MRDFVRVYKNLRLPYSIGKIQGDIRELCKDSDGKFEIDNENSVFNTFKISSGGFGNGFLDITLSKIDARNTNFEVTSYHGINSEEATNFMTLLSMKLSGERVSRETIRRIAGVKSPGCMGCLIILSIFFIIWFLVMQFL